MAHGKRRAPAAIAGVLPVASADRWTSCDIARPSMAISPSRHPHRCIFEEALIKPFHRPALSLPKGLPRGCRRGEPNPLPQRFLKDILTKIAV